MAKRHARSRTISPLNPSIHFILFLFLAFILVMIVAVVMQQASAAARARLFCPQSQASEKNVVEELSVRCPGGVQYIKDQNNCGVWVCKAPANRGTLPSPGIGLPASPVLLPKTY